MNEHKKYESTDFESQVVKEPAVCYMNSSISTRRVSDSVWEDIRIGLEQYRRGEYDCAWSFLESIKQ